MPSGFGRDGYGEPFRPFGSFISGLGAAQEMEYSGLRSQVAREALSRVQDEKAALKTYAAGGGDRDLLAAAPDTWMKLNKTQQEDVNNAMNYFDKVSPFWTVDNYGQQREDFYKKFPRFSQSLLPAADQMKTPEQLNSLVTRAQKLGTEVARQRAAALAGEQVKAQQDIYKTIKEPSMRLQFAFQTALTGQRYNNQLSLQENNQNFQAAQNEMTRKLQRDLSDAKTTEAREGHFMTNFRFGQTKLNDAYMKQVGEVDKMQLPAAEREAQVENIKNSYNYMQNELVKTYKPLADKYKIPFPYEVQKDLVDPSAGGSAAGKAGITPPAHLEGDAKTSYINAANRIASMPPGPAKEAAMKSLNERAAKMKSSAPGAM